MKSLLNLFGLGTSRPYYMGILGVKPTRLKLCYKPYTLSFRFMTDLNQKEKIKKFGNDQSQAESFGVKKESLYDPNIIFNIPNTLTLTRLLSAPFISYLIISSQHKLAMLTFFLSGLLDLLDGYIARKYNQHTILGSWLDPLADKLLVSTVLLTLCYQHYLPLYLGVIIIGRDALLIGGSFLLRYLYKPKGVGFFEISHPNVEKNEASVGLDNAKEKSDAKVKDSGVQAVSVSFLSKVNTLGQFGLLWFALTSAEFNIPNPFWLEKYGYLIATTTVLSGLDYLATGNVRRFLTKGDSK